MNDQASNLRGLVESLRAQETGTGEQVATIVPPSVATGAVSFAPSCVQRPKKPLPKRASLAKAIAVCSGKGGVGKSNLSVNLAASMSALGLKVCLLDADLGMANADVLCNLSPRLTLEHVVSGRCRLAEAVLLAPGGFRLIPGASGVSGMADLDTARRTNLINQLSALERLADVLIIDCGAGISPNVLTFAAAANHVIVVTTTEPTAMMDGYGMVKALFTQSPQSQIEVIVNMTGTEADGQSVFARMSRVSNTFLSKHLLYGGCIPDDPAVREAVRLRMPFVLLAPDSPAARTVKGISRRLAGLDDARIAQSAAQELSDQPSGFFSRVARWLGKQNQSQKVAAVR
ncbi:MAG TPA: MinD/ParA family protein [Phycisphaerales bacterium]|nr:MinD/ParA family protein [Phycisphaerales bacterium]